MNRTRVLMLLPLLVGLAHSFSWDIVVGDDQRLKFYYNGTLNHIEDIPSSNYITTVTYDPVDDRVLFADDQVWSISSFDLSTRKTKPLVTRIKEEIRSLEYDPVTQLLFWMQGMCNIYSLSLNPASSNKSVSGNVLVSLNHKCGDIALDSCGGFIYWATNDEIERVAFDGSERKVLINRTAYARRSLAIDQQTQKMYWIDETTTNRYSIESADLNGKNRKTFYSIGTDYWASALTVSKDYIYWQSYNQRAILQLPKNHQRDIGPIVYSESSELYVDKQLTAANYTIKEQTLGWNSCKALKSLMGNSSVPDTSDEEEHYGSTCENYCFQGNCSVSAGNQPKCSCKSGYFGERCEFNACYMYCLNNGVCSLNEAEKPVCQCTAYYEGERCDISICKDYCLQGNCSVNNDGQPNCRCNAGYSGDRCEVFACHGYCLNNGDCSLNEENDPVCQCTAGYGGKRCDIAYIADDLTQQILRNLRSEVKQVIREELQCTLQLFSDKLDENTAKIQKCEESMKNDQQNHDETTSNNQISATNTTTTTNNSPNKVLINKNKSGHAQ